MRRRRFHFSFHAVGHGNSSSRGESIAHHHQVRHPPRPSQWRDAAARPALKCKRRSVTSWPRWCHWRVKLTRYFSNNCAACGKNPVAATHLRRSSNAREIYVSHFPFLKCPSRFRFTKEPADKNSTAPIAPRRCTRARRRPTARERSRSGHRRLQGPGAVVSQCAFLRSL